jgi:hypothetical protein
MASPLDTLSSDPNVPAVNGANGASRGFLAANDPTFHLSTGVYGKSNDNGIVGETPSDQASGVFGQNFSTGNGVAGFSSKGLGVHGFSDTGTGVFGKCKSGHAIKGLQGTTGTGSGLTPDHGAGAYGDSDFGFGVYGSSLTSDGVRGESDHQTGVHGIAHRAESPAIIGENKAGGGLAGKFFGKVEITGDLTMFNGADIRLADFSEDFDVSGQEELEPGTVVVLDCEGLVQKSQTAYDKKVAGVISGAGDFRPAITLDRQTSQGNRIPIALMGKVYCKVDARYSPIEVGDLLTTSPTMGHAMKAEDPLKASGSVIGKALRPLQEGLGLVPILIALQ